MRIEIGHDQLLPGSTHAVRVVDEEDGTCTIEIDLREDHMLCLNFANRNDTIGWVNRLNQKLHQQR